MVINHNLASQNALRNTNINSSNASKSMEKLSSGLRINRAGDDAAGLAISEKMRAQVRGLDQASANAQDGVSMIQTAEGGLGETHSILQRMRELAVQASNDTNVAVDRSEIQKEMDELTKEVTRISNNTEFNTQKLINGGITDEGTGSAKFHIGANANQDITLSINAMDAKSLGITRDVKSGNIDTDHNTAKLSSVSADSVDVTKTLQDGKYKVVMSEQDAGATTATNSSGNTVAGLVSGTATADTNITLTYTDHGTAASNAAATAISATGNDLHAVTSLKLNGTSVKLSNTAGVTDGTDADVAGALQKDIDAALGKDKYTVSVDASHKLSITSVATGAATKVDLTGSDATSATALGFTGGVTGTAGTATGGVKDWVATGSLGGVVSEKNNSVNGITIDQAQLSKTAVVGETITVKGFKDATLSAQLQSVGSGVPATTLTGVTETLKDATVTGIANDNTNVTLTYHDTVTAANATIGAFRAGASGADTLEFNAGGVGAQFNGIKIAFSDTASGGINPAAQWDDKTNTITLSLSTTTANNLDTNLESVIQGLGTVTKTDGTTANLSAMTVTGAGTYASGGTAIADIPAATTATLSGGATALNAGWTVSGSTTGEIEATATTGNINGLTINAANIASGTRNPGDTIKINASVGKDIGNKVVVDQKNGGNYVLGDATSAGQLKVGIKAGTAVAGSTTVNLTTNEATSASKQADGTMSNATAIGGLDVSTQSKASAAVTTLQSAIEKVSAERSKLGAYQNRLEHTMANLGTSSENLTAAESRIRDVDMAKEMSAYSKNNILAQAAQSMLAQANQKPQQVLQLLQ